MKEIILPIAVLLTSVCGFSQTGFVEVRDEQRHHLVFENKLIRILDVHLAPGDTTKYHRHNTPSVFVFLSTTKTGSQIAGALPVTGVNRSGDINYDSLRTERIHQVWNIDTSWMHVMDIELKPNRIKFNRESLIINGVVPIFTEEQANGYRLTLAKGQGMELPPSRFGYLLISLERSEILFNTFITNEELTMRPGHYQWISAQQKVRIENTSIGTARFALLQF